MAGAEAESLWILDDTKPSTKCAVVWPTLRGGDDLPHLGQAYSVKIAPRTEYHGGRFAVPSTRKDVDCAVEFDLPEGAEPLVWFCSKAEIPQNEMVEGLLKQAQKAQQALDSKESVWCNPKFGDFIIVAPIAQEEKSTLGQVVAAETDALSGHCSLIMKKMFHHNTEKDVTEKYEFNDEEEMEGRVIKIDRSTRALNVNFDKTPINPASQPMKKKKKQQQPTQQQQQQNYHRAASAPTPDLSKRTPEPPIQRAKSASPYPRAGPDLNATARNHGRMSADDETEIDGDSTTNPTAASTGAPTAIPTAAPAAQPAAAPATAPGSMVQQPTASAILQHMENLLTTAKLPWHEKAAPGAWSGIDKSERLQDLLAQTQTMAAANLPASDPILTRFINIRDILAVVLSHDDRSKRLAIPRIWLLHGYRKYGPRGKEAISCLSAQRRKAILTPWVNACAAWSAVEQKHLYNLLVLHNRSVPSRNLVAIPAFLRVHQIENSGPIFDV